MLRVQFEAPTVAQLVELARQWILAPSPESAEASSTAQRAPQPVEELHQVLARINSSNTRKLLAAVAERSLSGEALVIDAELLQRLGLENPSVGVLGVANRTMRRRAHRELLRWVPAEGGYQMNLEDARVVIEVLGAPAPDHR